METSDAVTGHFPVQDNVYFSQGDQFVKNINKGQDITFGGSTEPSYQNFQTERNQGNEGRVTYGFTNERSAQLHQAPQNQKVQQGIYTQNPREQVKQQMDYSRNYGHVTVSVNDGAYQYEYGKQIAEGNQSMSNELQQAQLVNMDSDIQPSQRTYERRNKKKRPPEYYKQVEAEIEAERQRQFGVNLNSANVDWNQHVQNSQVDSYSNSVPSLPPSDNFRNQNYDSQQQQYMNYGTQNYSSHITTVPGTLDKKSLNRDNRFPDNSFGQQGPIVHHVNKPAYDRPVSNVNVYRKPVSNFGGQSDQVNDLHTWQKHSNTDQTTNYMYSNVHEDPAVLSAGSSTRQQTGVQEAASVSNFGPNNCDIEQNSNKIYDNRTNSVNVVSQELSDLSIQKNSAIENANNHHHHHASVMISHEETKPVTIIASNQLATDQNKEFPAIVPSNRSLNEGQNNIDITAETKETKSEIVPNSCDMPPVGTVDKVNVSITNKENISMDSHVQTENTDIQPTQAVEAPKPKVSSWAGLFRDTETAKSAVTIPYYTYQGTSASAPAFSQKEEEKKSKEVEKTPCEVTKDSAANMLGGNKYFVN
ncbi:hypothetical protein KUTeg_019705 [Tegillarca granosa]|uniref:Uncharacterized protein n=1 Tax=Tegillarca granosa TaxID=220873 RepID=A0ABQ9EDD7_TEGGR|nr:hypothetical protein KUTeg_019705 [Tegillarca granosa]